MKTLEEIRKEIDGIDEEMARLFEKRMNCVMSVAEYKYKNNEKIFDPEREKKVIENNLKRLKKEEYKNIYEKFLHDLMDHSKAFQKEWIESQKLLEKKGVDKQ